MAFKTIILAFAAAIQLAEGHYSFMRLRHNGEWQKPLQYIREAPMPGEGNVWERCWTCPTYYLDEWESVRCGRDNMAWAGDTEVMTVQAGDTIQMAMIAEGPDEKNEGWNPEYFTGCANDWGVCTAKKNTTWRFIHDGPVIVHLSKVPDGQSVNEYDGSGDWTKIYSLGLELRPEVDPVRPIHWLHTNSSDDNESGASYPSKMEFKIPEQTPPGEYLMRMDQQWVGTKDVWYSFSIAQLYPSCAQIRVESSSTTPMPEGVKIPEIFEYYGSGMLWSESMNNRTKVDEGYVYPGGPIWDGETLTPDTPKI